MPHSCSYCGLPVGRSWRHEPKDDGPLFCCYGCRFAAEVTRERGETGAAVWTLTKLGLAIFFTLNVVCFTMALWSDTVYGETSDALSVSYFDLLRYLGLLFSLPVLFLLGGPLLANAIDDVRHGRLSTDLLLMTGVLAAFGYSAVSVVRERGDVYFEVGCVILVTVTLGRWLEATGKLKATQALDELERLLPDRVRLVTDDGRNCMIPLAEVLPPSTVRVLAGERFPADGLLLSSSVSVDEQVLTGESWSVSKQKGDRILGGTLNLDGDVLLELTTSPSQTAVARLVAAVREARKSQGPYQRLSDRVSGWFFPMITAVAFLTLLFHWWQTSLDRGVMSALAVVLIACPCGLGLATPLAVWTAIGVAAKRQILFRNGEALERLAEICELCLDKTGTLTTGEARVTQLLTDDTTLRNDVVAMAKMLASSSSHSFSQAICHWRDDEKRHHEAPAKAFANLAVLTPVTSLIHRIGTAKTIPKLKVRSGMGVVAELPDFMAALGNGRLMTQCDFEISPELQQQINAIATQGEPFTLLGWSGRVRAVFVFAESLRSTAQELIDWCHHEDMLVSVLTGDHFSRGERLSKELAVPVYSELLPDQKAEFIRRRQQLRGPAKNIGWHALSHRRAWLSRTPFAIHQGVPPTRIGMVGDGVNDAAALTVAHIGISLGAGTDVSRDAAAVCLLNNDLSQLSFAIPLARRTVSTIRRNLAWAFGYNTAGIVLAASGYLNPAIAAFLMVISSFVVVRSSMSLSEPATCSNN